MKNAFKTCPKMFNNIFFAPLMKAKARNNALLLFTCLAVDYLPNNNGVYPIIC